jgi:DNA polymerase-3 subunit alpha
LVRGAGVHAAGVVIAPKPLTELVPVTHQERGIVTAYDMKAIEKMGLLKMDFLGLTTLTVIDDCAEADQADDAARMSIWRRFRWTMRRRTSRSFTRR